MLYDNLDSPEYRIAVGKCKKKSWHIKNLVLNYSISCWLYVKQKSFNTKMQCNKCVSNHLHLLAYITLYSTQGVLLIVLFTIANRVAPNFGFGKSEIRPFFPNSASAKFLAGFGRCQCNCSAFS